MSFYYQWQTETFIEGTEQELHRLHLDYPTAETREQAFLNCFPFLQTMVDRSLNEIQQAKTRAVRWSETQRKTLSLNPKELQLSKV